MSTGIAWTDETWAPVTGCTRVSAGCDHCYAYTLHDRRYAAWHRGTYPTAPWQYKTPFSSVQLLPGRIRQPEHWARPRRIFVTSMGDVGHAAVPDAYLDEILATMARCPQHVFQLLTKRPERLYHYLTDPETPGRIDCALGQRADPGTCLVELSTWPLPNLWLGTSVESMTVADRLTWLVSTPAAVHFVSAEPLLGPLNLRLWLYQEGHRRFLADQTTELLPEHRLDWIILGGESGPHARPCQELWLETLIDQARTAGTAAVFVKQLGSVWARQYQAHQQHGDDPEEWPKQLRVRDFPRSARLTATPLA